MKKIIAALLLCSCGTTATIYTTDGRVYDGTIRGHDRDNVLINGQSVSKRQISDVDHPGNVAGILGTIVAGIGLLNVPACTNQTPGGCARAAVWSLTGLPIAIYGWATHAESTDKAGLDE